MDKEQGKISRQINNFINAFKLFLRGMNSMCTVRSSLENIHISTDRPADIVPTDADTHACQCLPMTISMPADAYIDYNN